MKEELKDRIKRELESEAKNYDCDLFIPKKLMYAGLSGNEFSFIVSLFRNFTKEQQMDIVNGLECRPISIIQKKESDRINICTKTFRRCLKSLSSKNLLTYETTAFGTSIQLTLENLVDKYPDGIYPDGHGNFPDEEE